MLVVLSLTNKIVIVGVFSKFSGEGFENFTAVAEKFRSDYDFVHTSDAKFLPRGESSVTGPLITDGGGQLARWEDPYTTHIIKKEAATSSLKEEDTQPTWRETEIYTYHGSFSNMHSP